MSFYRFLVLLIWFRMVSGIPGFVAIFGEDMGIIYNVIQYTLWSNKHKYKLQRNRLPPIFWLLQ